MYCSAPLVGYSPVDAPRGDSSTGLAGPNWSESVDDEHLYFREYILSRTQTQVWFEPNDRAAGWYEKLQWSVTDKG